MDINKRYDAIKTIAERAAAAPVSVEKADIAFFAEDVFDREKMCRYLPKETAEKLLPTIDEGQPLDASIADEVASCMKEWAVERGATHYTHWFQPLTSGTAEKHDSFLELENGHAILSFSGKNLIMGEPDASSFPSGGLRRTFEARGYTAWDPTSPAFIKRHANGATLCIPTVFCSYTGEVLDRKTPLLRSCQALTHSVTRLMKCFGMPPEKVSITLGAEQEYFLIDRKFYLQRPDLVQTGRTLFGAPPPKHQQLEDHYFGAIRPRIAAFMTDVEKELWRLGIPAKTRHNEAAPAQFELAPIFEDVNLATDHNMLVMEVLRLVAGRYGLVCLLHEKPFAGINGSGKHNNWSVCYGKRNLLDPGISPRDNAVFLTMLGAVIRAVDLHADLLRSSAAGAGNMHRLGSNEAPPAIISIFIGDQLSDVIEQLTNGRTPNRKKPDTMRIGVDSIPPLARDATDRNRTSPFAFTGNKFEFRMPGSSQQCASVNMILNTIVAESIDCICDRLEALPKGKFNEGLQKIIRDAIVKHKRVIFNGDNYDESWKKEAEKRGLPNLATAIEAIAPLLKPENQELLQKYNVLTPAEVTSRHEVFAEEYHRKIGIEGGIALEITKSMILPAALRQMAGLQPLRSAFGEDVPGSYGASRHLADLGRLIDEITEKAEVLDNALSETSEKIISAMSDLRRSVDELEHLIDDREWPLPKYREMLFVY